jgi:hypothetical protein
VVRGQGPVPSGRAFAARRPHGTRAAARRSA